MKQPSQAGARAAPKKHVILFLAANPSGTDRLALDSEARSIHKVLRRSGFRDRFEFHTRWWAKPLDLLDEVRELRPTVVHFSGHGGAHISGAVDSAHGRDVVAEPSPSDGEPHGLYFHGTAGSAQVVSPEAMAQTLAAVGSVKVVVLNACFTAPVADALLAHVDCVVGMSGSIHDDAARNFAVGFYGGLGEHESIAVAFEQGRAAIKLEGLRDADRPQLKVRAAIDATELILAAVASVDDDPAPKTIPKTRSWKNVSGIVLAVLALVTIGAIVYVALHRQVQPTVVVDGGKPPDPVGPSDVADPVRQSDAGHLVGPSDATDPVKQSDTGHPVEPSDESYAKRASDATGIIQNENVSPGTPALECASFLIKNKKETYSNRVITTEECARALIRDLSHVSVYFAADGKAYNVESASPTGTTAGIFWFLKLAGQPKHTPLSACLRGAVKQDVPPKEGTLLSAFLNKSITIKVPLTKRGDKFIAKVDPVPENPRLRALPLVQYQDGLPVVIGVALDPPGEMMRFAETTVLCAFESNPEPPIPKLGHAGDHDPPTDANQGPVEPRRHTDALSPHESKSEQASQGTQRELGGDLANGSGGSPPVPAGSASSQHDNRTAPGGGLLNGNGGSNPVLGNSTSSQPGNRTAPGGDLANSHDVSNLSQSLKKVQADVNDKCADLSPAMIMVNVQVTVDQYGIVHPPRIVEDDEIKQRKYFKLRACIVNEISKETIPPSPKDGYEWSFVFVRSPQYHD